MGISSLATGKIWCGDISQHESRTSATMSNVAQPMPSPDPTRQRTHPGGQTTALYRDTFTQKTGEEADNSNSEVNGLALNVLDTKTPGDDLRQQVFPTGNDLAVRPPGSASLCKQ